MRKVLFLLSTLVLATMTQATIYRGTCAGGRVEWVINTNDSTITFTCVASAGNDGWTEDLYPYSSGGPGDGPGVKYVKKIIVGENIVRIGTYSLSHFYKAEVLILPSTLKRIGKGAFNECYHLKSITCKAVSPPIFYGQSYFSEPFYESLNKKKVSLYVPTGSLALYQEAEYWKDFNVIEYVEDTKSIDDIVIDDKAIKRIANGQLFIERSGKVYNAFGQEVR